MILAGDLARASSKLDVGEGAPGVNLEPFALRIGCDHEVSHALLHGELDIPAVMLGDGKYACGAESHLSYVHFVPVTT